MKIAIGCDHAAFKFKEQVKDFLKDHEIIDVGTNNEESCDFPDFAKEVADRVSREECERGILICTTGTGMCVAANKFPGVIASDFYSNTEESLWIIKHDREHLNSNVLCLSAKFLNMETTKKIIDLFLSTEFQTGERLIRRFNKVKEIEKENMKTTS